MKNFLMLIAGIIILVLLMILPGFVLYIVGDLANQLITNKEGGEG